jgi:hypothetical protein
VTQFSEKIEKFGVLHININVAIIFTNPFDPYDIQLNATIKNLDGMILMLRKAHSEMAK